MDTVNGIDWNAGLYTTNGKRVRLEAKLQDGRAVVRMGTKTVRIVDAGGKDDTGKVIVTNASKKIPKEKKQLPNLQAGQCVLLVRGRGHNPNLSEGVFVAYQDNETHRVRTCRISVTGRSKDMLIPRSRLFQNVGELRQYLLKILKQADAISN